MNSKMVLTAAFFAVFVLFSVNAASLRSEVKSEERGQHARTSFSVQEQRTSDTISKAVEDGAISTGMQNSSEMRSGQEQVPTAATLLNTSSDTTEDKCGETLPSYQQRCPFKYCDPLIDATKWICVETPEENIKFKEKYQDPVTKKVLPETIPHLRFRLICDYHNDTSTETSTFVPE